MSTCRTLVLWIREGRLVAVALGRGRPQVSDVVRWLFEKRVSIMFAHRHPTTVIDAAPPLLSRISRCYRCVCQPYVLLSILAFPCPSPLNPECDKMS